MINKLIFLHHEGITIPAGKETVAAGLGPVGQYVVILVLLLAIAFFLWKIRKKK